MFWTTYPLLNIFQEKCNNNIFKELRFERNPIESPTGVEGEIIEIKKTPKIIKEVREFLIKYFGKPPESPILDIPEDKLLGERDYILVVKDIDRNIVGCIRYHYLGIFVTGNNQEIYCEDCFCIHPNWRKKGVGDYLLTKLHIFVNKHNIPYSMFLKEGPKLSIFNDPFYSGMYVFRKTQSSKLTNIISLTVAQAYTLIDIFREFNNNTIFVIRNNKTRNQYWKLYQKDKRKILACFQDTYQRFNEDGENKRIGWITGWFESSNITDNFRKEASIELSDSMNTMFDYIWANSEWIGNSNEWKIDGSFNWYLYQWSTIINIKKSYCILN
jgi:GNAT superfamily N-acetyltransferase